MAPARWPSRTLGPRAGGPGQGRPSWPQRITAKNARWLVLDHLSSMKDLTFSWAVEVSVEQEARTRKKKVQKNEPDPMISAEAAFVSHVHNHEGDCAVITCCDIGIENTTDQVLIKKKMTKFGTSS